MILQYLPALIAGASSVCLSAFTLEILIGLANKPDNEPILQLASAQRLFTAGEPPDRVKVENTQLSRSLSGRDRLFSHATRVASRVKLHRLTVNLA